MPNNMPNTISNNLPIISTETSNTDSTNTPEAKTSAGVNIAMLSRPNIGANTSVNEVNDSSKNKSKTSGLEGEPEPKKQLLSVVAKKQVQQQHPRDSVSDTVWLYNKVRWAQGPSLPRPERGAITCTAGE